MKKLNLFSNLWSLLVGSRKDNGSTRLRVVFDSFTCRLRVWPLKLVSVLAILLTLGVGNVWGAYSTAPAGTYTLVTDASTLSAGDVIIIVNSNTAGPALSTTQNGNNRGSVAVTISNGEITLAAANTVQGLTLEAGTTSGTFAFNTGDGYLYAASSSNNYLRTEANKSANSSWSISISSGTATMTAQGTNTRNKIKYNSQNSIFSCYSSGTAAIFKKETSSTKTLLYNANGANGGSVPTDATAYNVNDGATVKTNSGELWRVGHTFDGWSRNANGTGKTYANPDTFKIGNSGNTLYAKWANTYANSEFTLVESLSELSAGSKIILVGTNAAGTSFFAMDTTQTGNAYRGQVASGAANSFSLSNSNKTITLGASTKVQVIELKDLATPATNTYQFYVETGYLYASSSSANELKTQSTNDANGNWLIELSEGVFTITAQGSNTRKILSYNNSATRFAAYTAIQQPTYIYVMEEGTKYTITWANGGHGTAPTSPTSASKVTLPELTYDGWQHTGWKANQAVTDVSTSSSISSGTLIANGKRVQLGANTTFTAQWKQILAAPTFSPEANTFNTTQSVELSCATVSGCSFRYTTDGSTPTSSSGTVYSGAISVTQTTTIKAIAYKDGCVDSEVSTGVFTLKCVAPSFDVAAGTYTGAQTVAISSTTAGASIHYTTDGSTPTGESATYSAPLTVDCSKTIKAIAVKTGWSNSNQGSATYHIKYNVTWKVDNAVYTPGSGGGGGTNGTASVECGNQVTQLPTPPDPAYNCGDKFMGWTTDEDYSDDSAPDDLFTTADDSPEITDHTTFYAVFADYTTD